MLFQEMPGVIQILENLQEQSFVWSLVSFSRHIDNIIYPGAEGKGKFL